MLAEVAHYTESDRAHRALKGPTCRSRCRHGRWHHRVGRVAPCTGRVAPEEAHCQLAVGEVGGMAGEVAFSARGGGGGAIAGENMDMHVQDELILMSEQLSARWTLKTEGVIRRRRRGGRALVPNVAVHVGGGHRLLEEEERKEEGLKAYNAIRSHARPLMSRGAKVLVEG